MSEFADRLTAAGVEPCEDGTDDRPHGTRLVLLGVLELHAPATRKLWNGREMTHCDHCWRLCHSMSGINCVDGGDAPYPCDTVRLIAEAYGVEAPPRVLRWFEKEEAELGAIKEEA